MTLLINAGPYIAVVLAAALATRAVVVARGRRWRPLAKRLALVVGPLGLLFVASIVLRFSAQ